MRSWSVLVIASVGVAAGVAACAGSPATPDELDPSDARAERMRTPIVRGAHGSAIDIIAATADGTAAVTQDAEGNTRLWPVLDGSAEPIVVRTAPAEELAVVRGADAFLVATLDAGGDLQLVRIAASGERRARPAVAADVPIEQLAVTGRYLLALRADQTIAVFEASGREHGRMATPPGSRTIALVTRGERALAIVARGDADHTRALDLDALGWGDERGTFRAVRPRFALSPSGALLAISAGANVQVIAPGGDTGYDGCVSGEDPAAASSESSPQLPLGFLDDHTLACLEFGQVRWHSLEDGKLPYVHALPTPALVAFGGETQITGEGLALGLARHQAMLYLGYRLAEPSALRTGPLGVTIARSAAPVVLDRALHATREVFVGPTATYDDVIPLDDDRVLRSDPLVGANHTISIGDGSTLTRIAEATDYQLHYDATTHLLGAVEAGHVALFHYDPDTHQFGPPLVLAGPPGPVFLTDPALAGGIAAVVVEAHGGVGERATVRAYAARDLRADAAGAPRHSYELGGEVVAVDRAARTYLATGDALQLYTTGAFHAPVLVARVPHAGRPVVVPRGDARAALVLGDDRVTWLERDGRVRWSVAAPGAVDAAWSDEAPIVRFGAGLATFAPNTGTIVARACGWQLSLGPARPENPGNARSVCDAS